MVAWRYRIYLLIVEQYFNSLAMLTCDIFYHTQRQISYLIEYQYTNKIRSVIFNAITILFTHYGQI